MRVYAYPADPWGCGHHRVIWPAQALAGRGHDITVIPFRQDVTRFRLFYDSLGRAVDGLYPHDADVMVFQRVCERGQVELIEHLVGRGIAVVVDVDDDLSSIPANNPAFTALHPRNIRNRTEPGRDVSWRYLHAACRAASLVTVSTPALIDRYARHGRVAVLPNFLADHYYGHERVDGPGIVWPAAYFAHPDDPQVLRGTIGQLKAEGMSFGLLGDSEGAGRAFGLPEDPPGTANIDLLAWPAALAKIGVGIAPLAATRFSEAKSWLKPLELSACGVPWVASPRAEYRRLHELGAGLVADKPKQWLRLLRQLTSSPVMRAELSQAGREVADGLRLADHAGLWWSAFEEARAIADRQAPADAGSRRG
jgi:hypothetical protein